MLWRKLLRDLKDNWGAYVACISVVVIGLMLYVSMSIIMDSLIECQDRYYRQYGFADGFAQIVRGPKGLTDDVADIKGVDKVAGRIVQNVLVYKQKGDDNTTVRLISFDPEKQSLNRFKLEQGRIPLADKREIMVTPAFLKANNYRLGDKISLIVQGRQVEFTITGTANSPEYIYEIPGGQTLTPDPKSFGIAFTPYTTLANVFAMDGQVNDIVFSLDQGVDFSQVKRPITRQLENYGLTQLVPRKDQVSHSVFSNEITQLKGSAKTAPVLFLIVAASILYIMLRRMVDQQRGQIGVLKAFGFGDWEIIRHYVSYAVIIGFAGGFLGGLAGSGLSYTFAQLYQTYYNIPGLSGQFSVTYIGSGTILSLLFSVFAGYLGCKGVLKLSPSEAMRPPAPKDSGKTVVERIKIFWQSLSTLSKMAVRNVFRSKQRSGLAVMGIAFAFSLMIAMGASYDAMYYLVDFQYDRVERYDLKIGLQNMVQVNEGVTGARHLQGIKNVEPLLEVPVTIRHRWLEKDIAIVGLADGNNLYRLVDDQGNNVQLTGDGLVISNQLAKTLDLQVGDKVTVKPFLGDKEERLVTVDKIVPQYVGLGAYMRIGALSKVLNEPVVATSLLSRVEREQMPDIRQELQSGKNVALIYDKVKMKSQFEQLMESSKSTQFISLFFSFIMGFAIVYNVNIISLSEREREMATLMVIGMTEREIGRILIFEQVILGFAAIVIGVPLSYGMLYGMVSAMATDMYNIPLIINPSTFVMSFAGTLLFIVAAQWKMYGRIGKLSMLDVLKQQD